LIKLTHIINPVKVTESSDLYKSQPITFASMLRAKSYTENLCQINLCATHFDEDNSIVPVGFLSLSNLTRSVLDVNPKLSGKKLPLIADIFDKFNEVPDADYYIYTNADIALMPYFYNVVHQYVLQGYDAIVINRRRISKKYADEDNLEMMYADIGKSHPGFDCFVIKKELISCLILDHICVGIPFVEVALVHNLFSFAKKPLFLPDAHLTFHIGFDVMPKRDKNFYWHNRIAYFAKVQPILKPHFNLSNFPYALLPFHKRAIKWVLNPGLFTRNFLELETKSMGKKIKYLLNEWRWRILQK
jgi:hypothetical protein